LLIFNHPSLYNHEFIHIALIVAFVVRHAV